MLLIMVDHGAVCGLCGTRALSDGAGLRLYSSVDGRCACVL